MIFQIGRDNLALTVFVPYDCKNNCRFCTTKESYKRKKASVENVKWQMQRVFEQFQYPIKDVVFTGGEPAEDVVLLSELVDIVPPEYHIYINTTFPKKNSEALIELVNENDKICGVNISRHCKTYDEDLEDLCDICEDAEIRKFIKPVRINCVINQRNAEDIEAIIDRWRGYGVTLQLRKDYRYTDYSDLHNPYDDLSMKLIELGYQYARHTQCNVCDSTTFTKGSSVITYHKGVERTAIWREDDVLEVNDLIIEQNGIFKLDWDEQDMRLVAEFEALYEKITLKDTSFGRGFLGVMTGCGMHTGTCGGGFRGCGGGC